MDISDALAQMRDPLGAPFYPQVIRALLVVTWALHIFFVTLALASSAFTVYGFVRPTDYRIRLARTTSRLTTSSVGLGIVTGIAPLLFIQTIYDPIWYASNSLTGFWSVMFVFVVMGGYGLAYLFYKKGSEQGRMVWSAVASFILIAFAGWIMHVFASVQLRPDEWMKWYAPDGVIDTRGVQFHDFDIPRLTFLLPLQAGLSFAVVLLLYGWYTARRVDADRPFIAWAAGLGKRVGLIVSPLYGACGVAWAAGQGRTYDLFAPMAIASIALGAGLTVAFASLSRPLEQARRALAAWFAALLVVAGIREAVRSEALSRFGYEVADYPYVVNWGSVILFLGTTVAGVAILVYLALVLYQSGLTDGVISMKVDRFGRVATAMLGAWFGFFLLIGLYAITILN